MLDTSKPSERRSVLEKPLGYLVFMLEDTKLKLDLMLQKITLKRADELKSNRKSNLENLKKQAEEASRYKEISKEIKSIEAGLYYLKLKKIDKEKSVIEEKLNEQEDEMSAVKIDLNHIIHF